MSDQGDTATDTKTAESRGVTRPGFAISNNPDAERYLLEADAMRRRQLRSALLHGSRRTWREHQRVWVGFVVGVIVVAVIVAAIVVKGAIQKTSENEKKQEQERQQTPSAPASTGPVSPAPTGAATTPPPTAVPPTQGTPAPTP